MRLRDLKPGQQFQFYPRNATYEVIENDGDFLTYGPVDDAARATCPLHPVLALSNWQVWPLD